jgi:hypothetical protein
MLLEQGEQPRPRWESQAQAAAVAKHRWALLQQQATVLLAVLEVLALAVEGQREGAPHQGRLSLCKVEMVQILLLPIRAAAVVAVVQQPLPRQATQTTTQPS